jgi:hypothetical protein
MQTQFSGKLTEADLNDVRRMLRSKMYWPKLLAKNWYGVLLLGAVLWATVAAATGATHPNWDGIALIWLVIAGIVAWAFYSSRKSIQKESARLNGTLPDTVIFDQNGIRLELPAGAKAYHPWQSFDHWREGERVILLDKQDGTFIMLSVAEIPAPERESVRQFLRGSIRPTMAATG